MEARSRSWWRSLQSSNLNLAVAQLQSCNTARLQVTSRYLPATVQVFCPRWLRDSNALNFPVCSVKPLVQCLIKEATPISQPPCLHLAMERQVLVTKHLLKSLRKLLKAQMSPSIQQDTNLSLWLPSWASQYCAIRRLITSCSRSIARCLNLKCQEKKIKQTIWLHQRIRIAPRQLQSLLRSSSLQTQVRKEKSLAKKRLRQVQRQSSFETPQSCAAPLWVTQSSTLARTLSYHQARQLEKKHRIHCIRYHTAVQLSLDLSNLIAHVQMKTHPWLNKLKQEAIIRSVRRHLRASS